MPVNKIYHFPYIAGEQQVSVYHFGYANNEVVVYSATAYGFFDPNVVNSELAVDVNLTFGEVTRAGDGSVLRDVHLQNLLQFPCNVDIYEFRES